MQKKEKSNNKKSGESIEKKVKKETNKKKANDESDKKKEGGKIIHGKGIIKKEHGLSFFEDIKKEVKFEQSKYFKRSVCRLSNEDVTNLTTIKEIMMMVQVNYNVLIKGTFVNYYKDGVDYCPYHKDSYQSDVITVSFGDTRDFYTKNDETKEVTKYKLEDGDVIFFDEVWNKENRHSIPQRKKIQGERISIVFFVQ